MISRRLLRIKVIKELYGFVSGQNSLPAAEKELRLSVGKTYEQYKYLFCFLPMLREYAQGKIDKGRLKYLPSDDEKNPNTKFVNNKLIGQIAANRELTDFLSKNSIIIADAERSVIPKMYANILGKDYFSEYMNSSQSSFEQDKKLVMNILSEEFEGFDDLYTMLEEQCIYWTDEPEFVVSVIVKTVKGIKVDTPFPLPPLYKNEDDEQFAQRLLRHAVVHYGKYNTLIDEHTPNWDVDRIAFMDTLILITAISEFIEFPNIPVKVTLDEYIDLARFYSTPSSCTFVNGVLDKIVEYFNKHNMLNKHGRGLI
jgi:N utilization substance protein B